MTVTATAAELEQGFAALSDLVTTVRTGIVTKAGVEQVTSDGFSIAEDVFPEYAPALMAANFLIDILIQRNSQGEPGSQTPMTGGPPSSRIAPP